jgi:hypothetical protein
VLGSQKPANSKEFDPEVVVTKVVWSGNAGYESWYATGMRCGLICIDDFNTHAYSIISLQIKLILKAKSDRLRDVERGSLLLQGPSNSQSKAKAKV